MSPSFNSEELGLFAKIHAQACAERNVTDEATRSLIATRIFHLAQDGERDPKKLLNYATDFVAARCVMADSHGSSMDLWRSPRGELRGPDMHSGRLARQLCAKYAYRASSPERDGARGCSFYDRCQGPTGLVKNPAGEPAGLGGGQRGSLGIGIR